MNARSYILPWWTRIKMPWCRSQVDAYVGICEEKPCQSSYRQFRSFSKSLCLKIIKYHREPLRELCTTFYSNPYITIVTCNNANEETDIASFYNGLSSLVWHIRKHNILIIDGGMNIHIGKIKNNKFCLNNLPNRNGSFFTREQASMHKY